MKPNTKLAMRHQACHAPQYVLYLDGAGYLANRQGLTGIKFTDNIKHARQFACGFDNEEMKLGIWNVTAKRLFNNPNVIFEIKYLNNGTTNV